MDEMQPIDITIKGSSMHRLDSSKELGGNWATFSIQTWFCISFIRHMDFRQQAQPQVRRGERTTEQIRREVMQILGLVCLITLKFSSAFTSSSRRISSSIRMATAVPEGIMIDVIAFTSADSAPICNMNEAIDFGKQLKSHKKAVLFAVPGAFTPTW